jgi:stage II sporulation protein D
MNKLFIDSNSNTQFKIELLAILAASLVYILFTCIPALAIDMESASDLDDTANLTLVSNNPINEIKVLITDSKDFRIPSSHSLLGYIGRVKGMLKVNGFKYSGKLDLYKDMQGTYIVNSIPLENYVKSVVMSELTDYWSFEALKTQAVIARTYAVNHILNKPNSLYHLTSSTNHQMYRGNQFSPMVSRAVDKTAGEVLTYDGKVIIAYYHSSSVDKTELPDEVFHKNYPYLKSVTTDSSLSPMSSWTRDIPYADFEAAVNVKGVEKVLIHSFTETGRVKFVKICGKDRDVIIETKDLRKLLGWKTLPSTMFTIADSTDKGVIIKGNGFGHGVGLSQWGALKMSRDGENYRTILSHYYPGTIIKLYDDL